MKKNMMTVVCLLGASLFVFAQGMKKGLEPERVVPKSKKKITAITNKALEDANIKRLSKYLFYTKKNDYFIVMERIKTFTVTENINTIFETQHSFTPKQNFWVHLINKQKNWINEYEKMPVKNKWGGKWPKDEAGRSSITEGLTGFQESFKLEQFDSLKFNKNNELWVAYISLKNPATDDIDHDDIEMFVSVMTTKNAPMVTHMGITRNFGHLIQNANNPQQFPRHKNLSPQLHSFAASVMKILHPQLRYMITNPTPPMAKILKSNFKEGAFVGDVLSEWKNKVNDRHVIQKALFEKEPELKELYKEEEEQLRKKTIKSKFLELLLVIFNSPEVLDQQAQAKQLREQFPQNKKEIDQLFNTIVPLLTKASDAVAMDLSPKKDGTPIRKTSYRTQIFDKDRKTIIYDAIYDADTKYIKSISVWGKKLNKNQYKTYDWFNHHSYIGKIYPFFTIEIGTLAKKYFK